MNLPRTSHIQHPCSSILVALRSTFTSISNMMTIILLQHIHNLKTAVEIVHFFPHIDLWLLMFRVLFPPTMRDPHVKFMIIVPNSTWLYLPTMALLNIKSSLPPSIRVGNDQNITKSHLFLDVFNKLLLLLHWKDTRLPPLLLCASAKQVIPQCRTRDSKIMS